MAEQMKSKHALKVMSSLEGMKRRNIVCDFVVRVQGKSFSVHRSVLVACSKYFEGMMTSDMKEARQGYVYMTNLSAEGVEQCIYFMYTGEVKITSNSVRSVIEASHLIELHNLTNICLQYLRDHLNGETCLHFINLFKVFGDDNDVITTESQIIESLDRVMLSEIFAQIDKRDLVRYLKSPTIDPEVHWKAAISWMEQSQYKDDDFLVEALDVLLSTRKVSLNFLFQHIWNHTLVQSSEKAKSLILQSISEGAKALEETLNVEISFILHEVMQNNDDYGKNLVEEFVTKHLAENFEEAAKHEKFVSINFEKLFDILQSTNLCIHDEVTKWEALITWVRNSRSRVKYLPDLMKKMKFEALPPDFVHQNIKGHLLVKKSAECLEILYDAMVTNQTQHSGNLSTTLAMNDTESRSLIKLDLGGGRHEEIVKLPTKGVQIVQVSERIYLIGRDKIAYKVYEVFKTGSCQLRSMKQLPSIGPIKVVGFRNKIYLVGREKMVSYDTVEGKWMENLPGCGLDTGFCVAASNDFIYALGGFCGMVDSSNKALRFNIELLIWIGIPPMLEKRWEAAAASYRGKIWVAGGWDKITPLSSIECYDPLTSSWEDVTSMNKMRSRFSLVVYKDQLYAVGGACDMDGKRLLRDSVEACGHESNEFKIVARMEKSGSLISSCRY